MKKDIERGSTRTEKGYSSDRAAAFESVYLHDQPDENAYSAQKSVEFIHVRTESFPPEVIPPIEKVEWMGDSWEKYYGKMVDLVARGLITSKDRVFPRSFPGAVIPGPEFSNQYIGSTGWEIFLHMLSIPERVIDSNLVQYDEENDTFAYNGERPQLEFSPIPMEEDWRWTIPQPVLSRMELNISSKPMSNRDLDERRSELLSSLQRQADIFWNEFKDLADEVSKDRLVRLMLELVQISMTPFVKNQVEPKVVSAAREILDVYANRGQRIPLLPLLYQIESSLMSGQTLSEREIVGRGVFGHTWIEVAKTPVEQIKSTELVNEKRAVDEVVNLVSRGWAPIITDERLNNTDGSHRGIAARIWALLKHLDKNQVLDHGLESDDLQRMVEQFVLERPDMSGLTLRETLRIVQAILTKSDYVGQKAFLMEAVKNYGDVKYVPTILLREQEACCVVKSPFDQDGKVIGVDPFVTYTLTNGRSDYALGSRGPYHRTDRSPAPWFDVFDLQRSSFEDN